MKVPFSDDPPSAERLLSALERIAMALELRAGIARPEDLSDAERTSSVSYTNDEDELKKEIRKQAYYERTGIRLADDEEPPSPRPTGNVPPAWP